MLAVNNYSLEKAYALAQGLRSLGLCSPENLGVWGEDEIARRLVQAGCNRGSFMVALYAKRLVSVAKKANKIGVEEFTTVLACEQRHKITELLLPIEGIGPTVLKNFFMLRRIK